MKSAKQILAKRIHVVVANVYMSDPEVMVFAGNLTERQVVESIAEDFEILSEKCPKTVNQLNTAAAGNIEYTLTTQTIINPATQPKVIAFRDCTDFQIQVAAKHCGLDEIDNHFMNAICSNPLTKRDRKLLTNALQRLGKNRVEVTGSYLTVKGN